MCCRVTDHTHTHAHTYTTELNTNKKEGCSPHVLDEQINNILQKRQWSLIKNVIVSGYVDQPNGFQCHINSALMLMNQML